MLKTVDALPVLALISYHHNHQQQHSVYPPSIAPLFTPSPLSLSSRLVPRDHEKEKQHSRRAYRHGDPLTFLRTRQSEAYFPTRRVRTALRKKSTTGHNKPHGPPLVDSSATHWASFCAFKSHQQPYEAKYPNDRYPTSSDPHASTS